MANCTCTTLLLCDQTYVRRAQTVCSLRTMERDKIARMCVHVWNRSRGLVLDIPRVGLDRVTPGTECKKALCMSFSSRRFIGATKRDLGNAHALNKYRDGPSREESCMRETNERTRPFISLCPFLFYIPRSRLRYCVRPLFQIVIYIFLHRPFSLLLIVLLFFL